MTSDLYAAMREDLIGVQQICDKLLEPLEFRGRLAEGDKCFYDALDQWKPSESGGHARGTPEDAYHLMANIWALCLLDRDDWEMAQNVLAFTVNGMLA